VLIPVQAFHEAAIAEKLGTQKQVSLRAPLIHALRSRMHLLLFNSKFNNFLKFLHVRPKKQVDVAKDFELDGDLLEAEPVHKLIAKKRYFRLHLYSAAAAAPAHLYSAAAAAAAAGCSCC